MKTELDFYEKMIPALHDMLIASVPDRAKREQMQDNNLYLRELRSITVNLGRKTGKTTGIARNCRSGDVVIVLNSRAADSILTRLTNKDWKQGGVVWDLFTGHDAESPSNEELLKTAKRVFIDDASQCGTDFINEVYKYLAENNPDVEAIFLIG